MNCRCSECNIRAMMSAHFFTAAAFRNSTSFSGLSFSWSPGEDSNRASSRGADKFLSASRQSDALIIRVPSSPKQKKPHIKSSTPNRTAGKLRQRIIDRPLLILFILLPVFIYLYSQRSSPRPPKMTATLTLNSTLKVPPLSYALLIL